MSRIGKKPVPFPKNVKIAINGNTISFEGPKGKLTLNHHPNAKVKVDGTNVVVERVDDEKISRAVHGLTRALVANNIKGVAEGYVKDLEIHGVGYKAELKGKTIPGIYKLEKGELTVAMNESGERPKEFKSDNGVIVLKLKKVEK